MPRLIRPSNKTCSNLPFGFSGPSFTARPTVRPPFRSTNPGGFRAAIAAVTWPVQKSTLNVAFLNAGNRATEIVRTQFKRLVPMWSDVCRIKFNVDDGIAPDILVNCLPRLVNGGADQLDFGVYQSYLGTQSQAFIAQGEPSMDLIFNVDDPQNDDMEYQRVILHEVGHALGFIHEQSIPGGLVWNVPAALAHYHRILPPTWSDDDIQQQILKPYEGPLLASTVLDPRSIMMYPIDPGLATLADGTPFSSGMNRDITALDGQLAAQIYGRSSGNGGGSDGGGSDGGGGGGRVEITEADRQLNLNAFLEDSITEPGQTRHYFFTATADDIQIHIETHNSTQALKGSLLGPDSTTTAPSTVINSIDLKNLDQARFLQPGRWRLDISCTNPTAKGSYGLSVTRIR